MNKIKKDEMGLYAFVGGYVARPTKDSRFKEGDSVKGYHFGGSTNIGMGKDATCKKGQYLETWQSYGTLAHEYKQTSIAKQKKSWDWYQSTLGLSIQEAIDQGIEPLEDM